MPIKHNTTSTKNDQQSKGFDIIFFALNFLLVPFSAYATYAGYKEFLDPFMAIILAAVTGLLFFGLNWFIADKRKKGEPHLRLIIGFLLPLLISFFGNFAYFYGGQMEGALLDKDLSTYKTVLTKTYNDAIGGLNQKQQHQIDSVITKNELVGLRTKLDSELGVLKLQIADGGCYSRCRQKWEEIRQLFADYNEKHLGTQGKPRYPVFTQTYANFERVANAQFAGYQIQEGKELQTIRQKIQSEKDYFDNNTNYKRLIALSDTLLRPINEPRLKSEGVLHIKTLKATNDQVGQYASTIISRYSYKVLDNYEAINRKNFKGVLENAFVTIESSSATFISVILSLVIDLATIGFVALILGYSSNKRTKRKRIQGPQRVD